MMAIMASGMLTLVDITDSKQLQLYISTNQPKTQIFNPNDSSYTPNWTTSKPVLTPQLFIAGNSQDIASQAKSIKWFVNGTEITASTADYTLSTTGLKTLTINKNVLSSGNAVLYVCEVVYTDPDTNYDVLAKADIEFVKVSSGEKGATGSAGQDGADGKNGTNGTNGADAVRSVVWTPDGNVIRNSTGALKAQCDFYKGAGILTSGVTYQWFVQDPSQSTDVGAGAGWKKLDSTYNLGTTGYATKTLTIPATAIPNIESFKCVATYGGLKYHDVCTVSDVTDPIMVNVTGTNVFKNGQGQVTLTAKLYQAGAEIDANNNEGFTYTWYLYDANNIKNTTWNTTGSKTGKTITVNASDVHSRGNIVCEATKQ